MAGSVAPPGFRDQSIRKSIGAGALSTAVAGGIGTWLLATGSPRTDKVNASAIAATGLAVVGAGIGLGTGVWLDQISTGQNFGNPQRVKHGAFVGGLSAATTLGVAGVALGGFVGSGGKSSHALSSQALRGAAVMGFLGLSLGAVAGAATGAGLGYIHGRHDEQG
jgi:hypothetical protein